MLLEIKQQLEDEQEADDAQNATNQAICYRNIQSFQNYIEYHTQTISSNEQLLSDTENLLIKAQEKNEQTLNDLASNNERYSEGESNREQENADYLLRSKDYEDALSAVSDAQQLVQSLQNGALFIQLKSKFTRVTNQLSVHKTKHFLYQPLIKSLTELASKADPEIVNKILALLESLGDALNESKNNEKTTEEKRTASWAQLSEDLMKERQTLTQKKQNLEENIDSYKNIIADAETQINQHSTELENNKLLLEQQEKWCDQTASNYETNTEERY